MKTPKKKKKWIRQFLNLETHMLEVYVASVPSNSTDCEPMCSFVMFTRVLWRTLMKGSWSLFIELTQISISTKKKKAKLHYSGSKDCTNEQMFRSVLFSGLRDQFVVCHYCHNPSDKCK